MEQRWNSFTDRERGKSAEVLNGEGADAGNLKPYASAFLIGCAVLGGSRAGPAAPDSPLRNSIRACSRAYFKRWR
jgi:hypothetical protein